MATGTTAGALLLAGLVGVAPATAAQPEPGSRHGEVLRRAGGRDGHQHRPLAHLRQPGRLSRHRHHRLPAGLGGQRGRELGQRPGRRRQGRPDRSLGRRGRSRRRHRVAHRHRRADPGARRLQPRPSGMFLTGTVTLDAKNNPAAVFIFQAGSTLITASGSRVKTDQRRAAVQRVLAGRQLRDARHRHDLRRHRDGAGLGDGPDQDDGQRAHPGQHRAGQPRHEHHPPTDAATRR